MMQSKPLLMLIPLFVLCAGLTTATAQEPVIDKSVPLPQTITVDCDAGQSLAAALKLPGLPRYCGPVLIEFLGACVEDVTIARDDVTIRGIHEDAAIVGTVIIEGASRVTLDGFTVRDSMVSGLRLRGGAAVTLEHIVAQDNKNGIFLEQASTALITDSVFRRNVVDGISVWGNSSITSDGYVEASENGRAGILISTGSGMQGLGSVLANGNGVAGVAAQLGGAIQIHGSVTTNNNNYIGVYLLYEGGMHAGVLDSVGNAFAAVYVEIDCNLLMQGGQIDGTGSFGMFVDSSNISLSDANVSEIFLEFGAQASFNGGNTVGAVYCDGTELIRGDAWCSKAATQDQSVEWPHTAFLDGPLAMDK
jgi:hypothetical protein